MSTRLFFSSLEHGFSFQFAPTKNGLEGDIVGVGSKEGGTLGDRLRLKQSLSPIAFCTNADRHARVAPGVMRDVDGRCARSPSYRNNLLQFDKFSYFSGPLEAHSHGGLVL